MSDARKCDQCDEYYTPSSSWIAASFVVATGRHPDRLSDICSAACLARFAEARTEDEQHRIFRLNMERELEEVSAKAAEAEQASREAQRSS